MPFSHSNGPILVATDGGSACAAAFDMARELHERTGRSIRVVSVVEPQAIVTPAPLFVATVSDAPRAAERRAIVQRQVDTWLAGVTDVDLVVRVGLVPDTLVQVARDSDACLVITGLVHHTRMERVARKETPLAVLRSAGMPVLALPATSARGIRIAVVAVDLSGHGAAIAAHASPILHAVERVHLVHVTEPVPPLADPMLLPPDDSDRVGDAFDRVRDALGLPAHVPVSTHVLCGRASWELAEFADSVHADVVVLGHEQRGAWGRLVHRSVAEQVYRLAACGVLVVPQQMPPQADIRRAPMAGIHTDVFARRGDWVRQLEGYTARNAGRRVTLAIFAPELAAQATAINFPLHEVAFEPATGRIAVTLQGSTPGAQRLALTTAEVTGIDLSRHENGSDLALRLSHDGGEWLLTCGA